MPTYLESKYVHRSEHRRVLNDALRHAREQSMVIETLLDKVADLSRELRVARARSGAPIPAQEASQVEYGVRMVKRMCELLKIDYQEITERTASGCLRRNRRVMEQRDKVIMHLLMENATPSGPLGWVALAEGLGNGIGHSVVTCAEKRLTEQLGKGWQKRKVAA